MTNMADMPIYGKNLKKNLLLQNQLTDDVETWYVALCMWVLVCDLVWDLPCVQQDSCLEGGPLLWIWPLYLHVNQKSDDDDTKIIQIISLGWPWPILSQGQIWSHRLLYGKKWKLFIF